MISTHKAETCLRLSRKDQDLLNVMNLLEIIYKDTPLKLL